MRQPILEAIALSPSSARQLAAASGAPLAAIAYHLAGLRRAARVRLAQPVHPEPGERVYEIASRP